MERKIIPSINCSNFDEAKKLIGEASQFSKELHIDISDGKFTPHISWGNSNEFAQLINDNQEFRNINFEIHLMVDDPEGQIDGWLRAGAKKIIVHVESIKDPIYVLDKCKKYNAECFLGSNPGTEAERLLVHVDDFNGFLILGVFPGPSGQKMNISVLEKIKLLRKHKKEIPIEIDGGVNAETAKLAKDVGANLFVVGSFIFGNEDPGQAYKLISGAVL